MAENIIQVTDENFDATVLQSDKPVLVDFWAEWCPPCEMVAPVIEELAAEYAGRLVVGKCNTDSNPRTPSKYKITAIPTLILFKNGEEVQRLVGFRGKAALASALDDLL